MFWIGPGGDAHAGNEIVASGGSPRFKGTDAVGDNVFALGSGLTGAGRLDLWSYTGASRFNFRSGGLDVFWVGPGGDVHGGNEFWASGTSPRYNLWANNGTIFSLGYSLTSANMIDFLS